MADVMSYCVVSWQMLAPNDIVADVIALADVIAIFIIFWWQMLLPQGRCFILLLQLGRCYCLMVLW